MNIEQPNSIIPTEASNLIIPVGRTEKVIKDNISEEQESVNDLISPIKVVSQSDNTEDQEKEYALPEPKTLKKTTLNFFIKLSPTQKISKIPDRFYSLEEIEDTPYPGLNDKIFQKAKFWSVYNNLQDTEFTISNVRCLQYRDDYYIDSPNGIEIYNGYYNNLSLIHI